MIQLSNITRRVRGRKQLVLDDVTTSFDNGVTAVIGSNGSGKSSLLRVVATADRPTRGALRWNEVDVLRRPDALRVVLGYAPQESASYPNLTTFEFLSYLAALRGIGSAAARGQIEALIEQFDLEPVRDTRTGALSGGTLRRAVLAQAFLGEPQVLVFDEPTAGLDADARARFTDFVREQARERIVLYCTHEETEIAAAADRVIEMRDGHIVADQRREVSWKRG